MKSYSVLEIYRFKSTMTAFAVDASNPVVGSSKNSTLGAVMSSIAMHARFFSPPEIPLIKLLPT